ncbi:MAG: hypothetical protein AABX00_06855 [Nanoarchaeota archaeon]
MASVSSISEEAMMQYHLFSRECRHHISRTISDHANYPNLRGPNTKGSKNVPPETYKARINILGRPMEMEHTGERRLNVGGLEVIVVVQAPLVDASDYLKGFDMANGVPMRTVIGDDLLKLQNISREIHDNWININPKMKSLLAEGSYLSFVQMMLHAIDNSIATAKIKYKQMH